LEVTVDTSSIAPLPRGDTREMRALALYRERGAEIERTGPYTYLMPSCTGTGSWAVNYRRETCDCPDFERCGVACKHIYAVGIHRAKRRGGRAV
jgi:hypothetical protein